MLKTLVKKQLYELFRAYFFDAKKNKMRSKGQIVGFITFFVVVIVICLGGMFTAISLSTGKQLIPVGLGWLYFAIMGGMAVALGAFGSVFNTYSSLFLAKDNDLLLSMPIPVKYIINSRLLSVYLLGALYAWSVMIPAEISYFIIAGVAFKTFLCALIMLITVTLIVLVLSCFLGWIVAKVSVKLKNKSIITAFISLVFIAAYYFFYFKASALLSYIMENANSIGQTLKVKAFPLYLFGQGGVGNVIAAISTLCIFIVLFLATWMLIEKSFLSIATSSGPGKKLVYKNKEFKAQSVDAALLSKEFARFVSSANYMLNCGLGIVMLLIVGILILIKSDYLLLHMGRTFGKGSDIFAALAILMIGSMNAMNDMATPSISLEGKNIWLLQSLPVTPFQIVRAKVRMQVILSLIPSIFCAICMIIAFHLPVGMAIFVLAVSAIFIVMVAYFDMWVGMERPIMNWSTEVIPIKQNLSVLVAIFGSWVPCVIFIGGFAFSHFLKVNAYIYFGVMTVLGLIFVYIFRLIVKKKCQKCIESL